MTEFELIARLTESLPHNPTVVIGAGDDCAVLDLGIRDRWVLFKTDAVVEGVHFLPETKPEQIGRKALARCLSDIAAMGGEPGSALITLGIPAHHDPTRLEAVYAGMKTLAAQHGVAIVGGETTTISHGMLISIALLGTVEKKQCVLRSGAKAGDAIFVTGELGGSRAGKHLDFEPRLAEARWLATHFAPHAMIDLSDGLAGDLPHILKASGVGAEVLAEAIPISRAARLQARQSRLTAATPDATPSQPAKAPLLAALTDGEDFELLFTIASARSVPLLDAWKKAFPDLRLSCIGKITAETGLRVRNRKGLAPLQAHGYTHFPQPG